MAQIINQETPMPFPDRPLMINGKKYLAATAERCRDCTAGERFLFLKMRLAGGEVVLECAYCDINVTKKAEQVRINMNKV